MQGSCSNNKNVNKIKLEHLLILAYKKQNCDSKSMLKKFLYKFIDLFLNE